MREGVSSSNFLWLIRACLCWMTLRFSGLCRHAAKYGGMICMHAENGGAIDVIVQRALAEGKRAPKYHALTRPTTAEAEATSRAIALAEMAGRRFISCIFLAMMRWRKCARLGIVGWRLMRKLVRSIFIFRSRIWMRRDLKGRSMFLLRRCGRNGIRKNFGRGWLRILCRWSLPTIARFVLRSRRNLAATISPKFLMAVLGFENRMSLVFSGGVNGGRFSVNRFVQLVSTAPAKLFGLYPRKGTIAVGSDADIVVFDPNEEMVISASTHHMRVDYSMFEGIRVKGVAKVVLSRGRVIVENGEFKGRAGSGEFIKRRQYSGV